MEQKNTSVMTEFQPSMSEWLASIGDEKASTDFRKEDNTKDERLELLYKLIDFPAERTTEFSVTQLIERDPVFIKFLEENGDELCALRLVPKRPDLPKFRNRGLSIREVYENWFPKQVINPDDYIASFRPHAEIYPWAFIFIIRPDGILGEMIPGQHIQLTHGDTTQPAIRFRNAFSSGEIQNEVPGAREALDQALSYAYVADPKKQQELRQMLEVEFAHDYLTGYYEAIMLPNGLIRFGDYNRILHNRIEIPASLHVETKGIAGTPASRGKARGKVRIVLPDEIDTTDFAEGDILVTDNTDVRFVPLMKKAGAIVTNRGGMLSHASIVARELKKPCVVGTRVATTELKNGDLIEVDADLGVVKVL
jgi:phosphohistidine swiveling domain-containing protein